jgi:mercuric ion transport protein
LTAIGLGFLIHDAILIPLFIGFIGFNLWMLSRSVNKQEACATETMPPFKLAAIGGVISILGLLLSVTGIGLATLLIYIGLGLFFVGNFRVYKGNSHAC